MLVNSMSTNQITLIPLTALVKLTQDTIGWRYFFQPKEKNNVRRI
jgi:hypothetical protein